MDLDPNDLVETARTAHPSGNERAVRGARPNAAVAITVAVLATFMGICWVKGDNIVQTMQQAQADGLDHWAFYQARNIHQDLAEATAIQLEPARVGAPAAAAAGYDAAIAKYRALAADQTNKKDARKARAEPDQKTHDALNDRGDPFDLSDALIAIAIAIAMRAVSALTRFRAL